MTYILFLSSIIFFTPLTKKSDEQKVTFFFYVIIFFIACTRFGVGVDYFSYYNIYRAMPVGSPGSLFIRLLTLYTEPGFSLLMMIFRYFNMSFIQFIALCACISLVMIFSTIQKYSNNKIISFFIFYSHYYLVYIESIVRQGIAMAIFLYAFFSFIDNKKTIKYILFILLGMTFHVSIVIALFIPIIIKLKNKYFLSPFPLIVLSIFSFLCGYIFFLPFLNLFLSETPFSRYLRYSNSNNVNISAVLFRMFKLVFIYIIYFRVKKHLLPEDKLVLKIYIIGLLFYFFICQMSLLSRMSNYFMILEIILIPNMIKHLSKNEKIFMVNVYIILFSFIYIKDIDSFLNLREYYSKSVFDYNHITIFNKEKILEVLPGDVSKRYFLDHR